MVSSNLAAGATPGLRYIGTVADNSLAAPSGLALDRDGDHLYVASSQDDALAVFRRDDDTGELHHVQTHVDGDGGVNGLNGIFDVALSPDGRNLYAASPNDRHLYVVRPASDALLVFRRSGSTGTLGFVMAVVDDEGTTRDLDGAYDTAVSPDGDWVFVASQFSNTVVVFAREPGQPWPNLTYLETWVDGLHGVDGLRTANGLALSRDDRTLYASGYDDDAVVIFGTRASVYLPVVLR